MKLAAEYFLLIILLTFLVIKGISPGWNQVHSDFANYYVSSKLILEDESLDSLYDNEWFKQKIKDHGIQTQGKFSPFPPATAWLMIPLTTFNPLTAQRIFLIVNMVFTLAGIILLQKILHWKIHYCTLLIFGSGLSLANNFAFGQVYWIITFLILLSVLLVKKNYPVIAGGLLTTLAAIKYFPAVFVGGYFLNSFQSRNIDVNSFYIRRNGRKVFISALIFGIVIIAAELAFFGNDVLKEFISSVFLPHLDGTLTDQGLYSFHYQSWDNLFRNLFMKDPEFNPVPFIDWPTGKTVFKILVMSIAIGLMLKVLYHYRNSEVQKREAVYLSVPALAALVILPASATYHFILLLAPIVIIISQDLVERNLLIVTVIIYIIIGFIPYGTAFDLGKSIGLIFAYPRLWLISILYAIVLYGLSKRISNKR